MLANQSTGAITNRAQDAILPHVPLDPNDVDFALQIVCGIEHHAPSIAPLLLKCLTVVGPREIVNRRFLARRALRFPLTLRLLHNGNQRRKRHMSSGPSDYLAAERTFLAWIRTGLALMGFGFVVARFGLFLRMLQIGQPIQPPESYGLSFWLGTTLIIVGVVVNMWSVRHHLRLVDDLNRGGSDYKRPSLLAIAVALILALTGAVMATYLISVGDPKQSRQEKAFLEKKMTPGRDNGIVSIPSNHTVDQTVVKLEAILQTKGVKLFALIDHSGEAEKAGMQMRPTKLLIFGNPKAGTPLMLASPGIAIDLPLKILVAEDESGKVQVSWNSPAWLQTRHHFPQDLLPNIAVVEVLATKAAG
jgi:uncharacterized protein (DUF302 family)/uncharacterized membrane protein YidH (DUF202 family)